jgi:tetratricopeptide (TPR) repeat protein
MTFKKYSTLTALFFAALLMLYFPIRDLAADHFHGRVAHLLDDETTEGLDIQTISEKSMPAWLAAIDSLKTAIALAPSRALHQGALAELYMRLGKWAETMQSLKAPLPSGAPTGKTATDQAISHLKRAIALEPANPDYHLALGRVYSSVPEFQSLAAPELKKAAAAFPVNAPLRYFVAMQYLLSGSRGDAIEQARILAKIDDTYILHDPEKHADMIERQTPGYLAMLSGSYLYSALEIAWRASKDIEVVKGIAPDNPDAAPVLQLFLMSDRAHVK